MDRFFTRIATTISTAAGQPQAFLLAVFMILGWSLAAPIFRYSDTWQLVLNTGASVITLLNVFIIQNSQNRDAGAMQAKLNELLRAVLKAHQKNCWRLGPSLVKCPSLVSSATLMQVSISKPLRDV